MNNLVNAIELEKLKIPISGYDAIPIQGQFGQDLFVIAMSNGKKNGTYLEIGCGYPIGGGNNTFSLETYFNWSGISIDSGRDYNVPTDPLATILSLKDEWKIHRPTSSFLQDDARNIDYSTFPKYFDYLQIDVDPPDQSLEVLKKITEHIKFSMITFEHDYIMSTQSNFQTFTNSISYKTTRDLSRNYLTSLGYFLIIPDINYSEDWWVDPSIISKEIVNAYTTTPKNNNWFDSLLQNVTR